MSPVNVTLEEYGGWGVLYGLIALFVIVGVLLFVFGRAKDDDKGGYYVNRWWFVSVVGIAVAVIGPAISFATIVSISQGWDEQQRITALHEQAGFTQVKLTGEQRGVRNEFIGSQNGNYIIGSFVQVEGTEWIIIGAEQ